MHNENINRASSTNEINERLAYVDFKLRFTGHISRLDLKETFGIAEAAASRVLTEYGELKANNKTQKANTIIRDSFSPLLSIDGETALGMLANGFNKNKLTNNTVVPYEKIGAIPHQLDVAEVAMITRAIEGGYAIKCNYFSQNSDKYGERVLLPLAIMYDGTHWMYRAFDRSEEGSNRFKNFHFARTCNVKEEFQAKEYKRLGTEELQSDKAWNLRVPLVLKLHESLDHKKKSEIQRDFGMHAEDEELLISERQAFLWILEKKWFIDNRSPEKREFEKEQKIKRFYKFELTNSDMIRMLISQT